MLPQRGLGLRGVGALQGLLLGAAAWGPGPVLQPEGVALSTQEIGKQTPIRELSGSFSVRKNLVTLPQRQRLVVPTLLLTLSSNLICSGFELSVPSIACTDNVVLKQNTLVAVVR